MFENIIKFFENNQIASILLDGYLLLLIIIILIKFIITNKKIFNLLLLIMIFYGLLYVVNKLDLVASGVIYNSIAKYFPVAFIVIFAPEIRGFINNLWYRKTEKKLANSSASDKTKLEIVDACVGLSQKRQGALMTIEKHNSLDQYAENAVVLNCDVTKELLMTIFWPSTPLHDGAVIIRGNKIRCAGAYFKLTSLENLDKTMGSRHRAALGISEVSDSLTIVVSEETGRISITTGGVMIKIADKQALLEYLDLFIK